MYLNEYCVPQAARSITEGEAWHAFPHPTPTLFFQQSFFLNLHIQLLIIIPFLEEGVRKDLHEFWKNLFF